MADKASALVALARAINEFLDSGLRSGGDDEQEPPDRGEVSSGGQLHNAIVQTEAAYGGALPQPNPRSAWITLTKARDGIEDDLEWQEIAAICGQSLIDWIATELAVLNSNFDPSVGEALGRKEYADLAYEKKYRDLAKQLIPGFDAPRDIEKMAALLCRVMHLQPSEFRTLGPKGRYEFALMAKDVLDGAPPANDKGQKLSQGMPDNPDVRDLCHLLDKNREQISTGTKTEIGLAREFTRGNNVKAKNLLRQARRYPHLWKR